MASKKKRGGAQKGDTVIVHFQVKFTTGQVIHSTLQSEPVRIVLGKGEREIGLEEAIVGMKPGTTKTVILPPSKTFGERRDDLFFPLPRSQFPQDTIIVGELIDIPAPDGSTLTGRVRLVDDYMVVVDLNNPLAGHELIYEISLLSIEQAS